MIKLLFICHGNICRSPMAEFIMKKIVTDNNYSSKIHIESRATSNEETGNSIYPNALKSLLSHSIPIYEKVSEILTKDDCNNFDLLIAMDNTNVSNIKHITNEKNYKKIRKLASFDIADPWYTRNFEKCFEDIYKYCIILFEELKRGCKKIIYQS